MSTTSSPRDVKKPLPKEEPQTSETLAPPQESTATRAEDLTTDTKVDNTSAVDNTNNSNAVQPLAPPPKPNQQNKGESGGPDYFSGQHNSTHFSLEPNPFEQSFGNPSTETPRGFPGLPSVASLTSPAPIGADGTPGWHLGGNSLRSGPLSPAMLTGPANPTSYFDDQFRPSFPTPNESSLRTGLTPGGGGSMFPAPSPSSQAIFNSIQGGLATPGTLDFHRTALNAAARSKVDTNIQAQPQQQGVHKSEFQQPGAPASMTAPDPFGNHPDRDAVNSLYMLAQTGNRNANQFAVPPPPQSVQNHIQQARMNPPSQDTSPSSQRGGRPSNAGQDGSPFDRSGSDEKAGGKGRGKKNSIGKGASNGRRKAEDPPAKGPAGKKAKNNASVPAYMMDDDDDMMDDDDIKDEPDQMIGGRKMTDEEKRKNFLERNRVAALKCRQRKKQWLANLQAKVEIFTSENDALNAQNSQLREEIMNLKTLLMAHRDCPVSHQQGLAGNTMQQVIGADFAAQPNPYGMAMQNGPMPGQQMHPGPGMQRR